MSDTSRIDLDDYLPYLVNRVGMAVVARFSAETLVHHDLSIAMWRVLVVLSANGAQRQIDLADKTSIDVSTLSRLVTRLVKRGLVTRLRSKTSNREVVIDLAAKGRALVERLLPDGHAIEMVSIAGIPPQDLAVAKRVLRRAFANITGTGRRICSPDERSDRRFAPTEHGLREIRGKPLRR